MNEREMRLPAVLKISQVPWRFWATLMWWQEPRHEESPCVSVEFTRLRKGSLRPSYAGAACYW